MRGGVRPGPTWNSLGHPISKGQPSVKSFLNLGAGAAGKGLDCGQRLLQFCRLNQGTKNQSKGYHLQPYMCVRGGGGWECLKMSMKF